MDELFEFTHLSSPNVAMQLDTVDLSGLLQQILGEYSPIFEKEQLQLDKQIPNADILISIDVEKMVRVYDNLLTNAMKYSPKPSKVQLALLLKEHTAVLRISNQMMQPLVIEGTEKLFERFFRGDQARATVGSGLGFSISKNSRVSPRANLCRN